LEDDVMHDKQFWRVAKEGQWLAETYAGRDADDMVDRIRKEPTEK